MKNEQRTTSIARRINWSWLLRMLGTFIILDLMIAALSVAGWCYAAEGGNLRVHTDRALQWNETAWAVRWTARIPLLFQQAPLRITGTVRP